MVNKRNQGFPYDFSFKLGIKPDKKAQMKIQQTSFMLIAVTLFFVFVGLFVLGFNLAGLKKAATNLDEKNAMLLSTKLANSPEFACGESFDRKRINCIDADKVMILRENIERYNGFWSVSDIKIRKIYPSEGEIPCTLENYPNCDIINIISEEVIGTYVSTFVSLCRKEAVNDDFYNKCELAKLMVSYEIRE